MINQTWLAVSFFSCLDRSVNVKQAAVLLCTWRERSLINYLNRVDSVNITAGLNNKNQK